MEAISMGTLSVTVDTDDAVVLEEVGAMFGRLAERRRAPGREFTEERVRAYAGYLENENAFAAEPASVFSEAPAEQTVDAGSAFAAQPEVEEDQPVTPVPPAPPQTAPPAAAVELDKNGLPWDHRINTTNKAKTAPGAWKRKPGITDEEYNNVIAELRQMMGAPAPAVPALVAPVATPPPPAAAPVTEEAVTTFPQLLQAVTKRTASGLITPEEVSAVCQGHGIPSLPLVGTKPELIPNIFNDLKAIWDTRA